MIVYYTTVPMKPKVLTNTNVTTTAGSTTLNGILDHLYVDGDNNVTFTFTDPDGDTAAFVVKAGLIFTVPIPFTKLTWSTASGTSSFRGAALIPKPKAEMKAGWNVFL